MSQDPTTTDLLELVRELREEIARMNERIGALEGEGVKRTSAGSPTTVEKASDQRKGVERQSVPKKQEEPISEELILVISAAIAGCFGKQAPIRQIRLIGSAAWAQQGRVTIQASHRTGGQS